MACVRTAWLTMNGSSILLEDPESGYFCTSFDLGAPAVRDVLNNRPDGDGVDDRTLYFGARAVTANITALTGAGAQIDAVASAFAPYMVPSARPVLHYVLDRPGAAERTLVVRAASYDWKIEGDQQRDIQLQWVAADPAVQDPVAKTATAWAGSALNPGRLYNLTYPRTYPAGGNTANTATIHSNGDLSVQPLVRIYGPISGAAVHFAVPSGPTFTVGFVSTFTIGAGAWVDIDTNQKTAYYQGDINQNVLASMDWPNLTWPVLPPNVDNQMTLTGGATSGVTQAVATWNDRYLT
jgi:hypothetical protein